MESYNYDSSGMIPEYFCKLKYFEFYSILIVESLILTVK